MTTFTTTEFKGQKTNHALVSKDQRTVRNAVDAMLSEGKSKEWISQQLGGNVAYFNNLDVDFVNREIENYLRSK